MNSLRKFSRIRLKYAKSVDFLAVYIEEAHPAERDHFTGNYNISTHQSFKDRLAAAETLDEEAGNTLDNVPIVVDRMDNAANTAYAALPERLYVVQDGKIIYAGEPGPFGYNLEELDTFLSTQQ